MTPAIKVYKPTQPAWTRGKTIDHLAEIYKPRVQICSWLRALDPDIKTYLNDLNNPGTLQIIESPDKLESLELNRLPDGYGRKALIKDLNLLREIMHDLIGCSSIGLRIAQVDHAMCPGWHIDKTGVRLVCTYQGPGTEWLDDQKVNHQSLSSSAIQNFPFQQAAEAEVVLLKGSLWPENEKFGSIHRSPELEKFEGLRTVVTLDPLWDD